jgi:hypothetical protein
MQVAQVFRDRLKNTVWFHVPNGEKRDRVTATKLKQMGVRPGVADFIILHKGQSIALELKREGGRMSKDQIGFEKVWRANGGSYLVVFSIKMAEDLIFQLGMN